MALQGPHQVACKSMITSWPCLWKGRAFHSASDATFTLLGVETERGGNDMRASIQHCSGSERRWAALAQLLRACTELPSWGRGPPTSTLHGAFHRGDPPHFAGQYVLREGLLLRGHGCLLSGGLEENDCRTAGVQELI